jgi:predicted TIM-barrel fold metal-dependent hydrolase
MIIDIHNHITVKDSPFHLPAEEYLSVMDELGVDKVVVLGKDYGLLGDRLHSNLPDEDVVSFVTAHPDRFIGFSAVHPDRDINSNIERLERAVHKYGLKGIKLNPASGFYPNDERLYPVYETCSQMNLPVMIHMGIKPPSEGTRMKYCHPMSIDDIAADFPELTLIIAHAAYPWVEDLITVSLYAQNIFVDISTLNQLEEALGYEVIVPTLRKLSASLGPNRVVFGSDGIFNLEALINAVRNAHFLSASEKERILWKNTAEILKF